MASNTNASARNEPVWGSVPTSSTGDAPVQDAPVKGQPAPDAPKSTIVPEAIPTGTFVPMSSGTPLEAVAMANYGDKIHADLADKRPDDKTFDNPNDANAAGKVREYGDAVAAKAREYADRLFQHNLRLGFMRQRNVTTVGQSIHVPDSLPELPDTSKK